MKFLPFFAFVFLLVSCQEDHPAQQPVKVVDTLHLGEVDSAFVLADTIVGADGKQVIVHHDCSILKKRIPPDSALEELQYDLDELRFCVDSFDFRYVVPNLLASWLSEQRVIGNNKVTYGDFVKHMDEFKRTQSYAELHDQVMALDSVKSLPFDATKIESMRPTFGKLGMTEPEWNAFSGFARTYPIPEKAQTIFTWGDMMDAFETYWAKYNEENQ